MWSGPYDLAKAALFRLDAEDAHHLILGGMRRAERLGLLGRGVDAGGPVEVMGLRFANRLGLAAGMDKTGESVDAFGALGFGHVEVGTVTPRPQPGNPRPRLFRLVRHEAIINRMGFNNPGLDAVLAHLATRRTFRGVLGVNLGKNFDTPNERAADDYLAGFRAVYPVADYVTVNLSSPNTKGLRDLQAAASVEALFGALLTARERLAGEHGVRRPIALKVAPDLTDEQTVDLAAACNRIGIDALIATNTTLDRSRVQDDPLAGETGGLSGRPLGARSLECLKLWRAELDRNIPIISVGGILTGADAKARIEAGAALLQVYTGLVYRGPALVRDILRALGGEANASA